MGIRPVRLTIRELKVDGALFLGKKKFTDLVKARKGWTPS